MQRLHHQHIERRSCFDGLAWVVRRLYPSIMKRYRTNRTFRNAVCQGMEPFCDPQGSTARDETVDLAHTDRHTTPDSPIPAFFQEILHHVFVITGVEALQPLRKL